MKILVNVVIAMLLTTCASVVPLPTVLTTPVPIASPVAAGCMIGRLSNHVIATDTPFPFGEVIDLGLDCSGMWDVSRPSQLVIPTTGLWIVGSDITTLGINYGGPNNQQVILEIVRNWSGDEATDPHLIADVAAERFWNENGTQANINSLSFQPVWLEAGDVLELLIRGRDGSLLVESNPSDGVPSGYVTDAGPGTISPHLYALSWIDDS